MAETYIIDEEKIKKELKRSKKNWEKIQEDNSLYRTKEYIGTIVDNQLADVWNNWTSKRIPKIYDTLPNILKNRKVMKKIEKHVHAEKFSFDSWGITSDVYSVVSAEDPAKEITKLIIEKPLMYFWGKTPLGKIPFIREAGEVVIEEYVGKYSNSYVDNLRKKNGVEFRDGDVRRIKGEQPKRMTYNYYAFSKPKKTWSYSVSNKEADIVNAKKQEFADKIKRKWLHQLKKVNKSSPVKRAVKTTYSYKQSKSLAQYYRKKAKEDNVKRKKTMKKIVGAGKKVLSTIKNALKFPFIKRHANGGFIYGTTLSYVGEEGPEVIIPLESNRRRRGIELWEKTGTKLGVKKIAKNQKSNRQIFLLELLRTQREQVSEELCSIIADALEGAYKNIPLAT